MTIQGQEQHFIRDKDRDGTVFDRCFFCLKRLDKRLELGTILKVKEYINPWSVEVISGNFNIWLEYTTCEEDAKKHNLKKHNNQDQI